MSPSIADIAIPFGVGGLVSFLAYSSQYLLRDLQPGPVTVRETWTFNILVTCIWICYYRSCLVDPGHIPKDWKASPTDDSGSGKADTTREDDVVQHHRWCRKCESLKPPRTHHCKGCGRCIPKMDHHCPWTRNCVSYFTFPHFIRFLFYAVASMFYLERLLFGRVSAVWQSRHKPSYLGPSVMQLAHLFILFVVNSLTLAALSILLIRSIYSLGANVTTIESWEIERHETLLRRARHFGGYLDGPDGIQVRIKKQEFPYDIGIWKNIKAGMGGSSNIIGWLWPLSATPDRRGGFEFEVNGFEDSTTTWPPPDPDRIPRKLRAVDIEGPFSVHHYDSPREETEAFYRRQQEDMQRRGLSAGLQRRKKFYNRLQGDQYEDPNVSFSENELSSQDESNYEGEESWRNADGERLEDFGVDEDIDFYDEDNIPLAELMERKREKQL